MKRFLPLLLFIAVLLPGLPDSLEAATLGSNLITNPSFEASTTATGWFKGGYGSNTRVLSFPVAGFNTPQAARVEITNYTSGDAKWYFAPITISGGKVYQFSDDYKSNVASIVDVEFRLSDGTYVYKDILTLPETSGQYKHAEAQVTAPTGAVSLRIFHLINRIGVLDTDNYSLNEVIADASSGLVKNGDFEMGTTGVPLYWKSSRWGTNSVAFNYPAAGAGGSKGASATLTSRTSGDAKWYFEPINLSPGIYTYTDEYQSSVTTFITAQFQHEDGSYSYLDLKLLPVSSGFSKSSAEFQVPVGVSKVTVFHLINTVGTLTIDNVALVKSGALPQGQVSLTFDDGWLSQYENAWPKLIQSGLRGTFYIVSQRFSEDGFPAYISQSELRDIYNSGQEIGAHTRSHVDLTQLSFTDAKNEILGSRNDLLALNVGPILSFAYPFGAYNASIVSMVKEAGFSSARSTNSGYAEPLTDAYTLRRESVNYDTSFAQVKSWIDLAIRDGEWLILVFHEVNHDSRLYSTTPETFNQIVDYLVANHIKVSTITEALVNLQK